MWKFDWFLRDFRYDTDFSGSEEIDEKASDRAYGNHPHFPDRSERPNYLDLSGFASAEDWDEATLHRLGQWRGTAMTFSYSQISRISSLPKSLPLSVSRRMAGQGRSRVARLRSRV